MTDKRQCLMQWKGNTPVTEKNQTDKLTVQLEKTDFKGESHSDRT